MTKQNIVQLTGDNMVRSNNVIKILTSKLLITFQASCWYYTDFVLKCISRNLTISAEKPKFRGSVSFLW